jgi:Mn-containing catalase
MPKQRRGTQMPIELTDEEASLVKELLGGALGEIKAEIRHTETDSFRRALHEKEEQIRALLERL